MNNSILKLIVFLLMLLLLISTAGIYQQTRGDRQQNIAVDYIVSEILMLEGVHHLSGITYHPPSDKLYAVSKNSQRLFVLDKQGTVAREIALIGFQNTEGIDYMHGDYFVVAEEKRRVLAIFEINNDTLQIDYDNAEKILVADPQGDNQGLEDVVWSEQSSLFIIQEHQARFIHQSDSVEDNNTATTLKRTQLNVRDLSGLSLLHGHPEQLLAVSDDSHSLHTLDLNGVELSSLQLRKGLFNLWPIVRKPVGLTIDLQGHIYIIGAPNQLLILTPRSPWNSSHKKADKPPFL